MLNFKKRKHVTRGYGLLEYFLAAQRAKLANKLISQEHREGTIVDIGCGSYPIFLLTTKFVKKFGIDKSSSLTRNIFKKFNVINYNIEKGSKLPFKEKSVDVVTMLAVFEHIEYDILVETMAEISRILKPEGLCIITTPACWTHSLLIIMGKLKLVSAVEISEHKSIYNNKKIINLLNNSGFSSVKSGYFELFLNRFFLARK